MKDTTFDIHVHADTGNMVTHTKNTPEVSISASEVREQHL
mgnify:FL=1